MFYLGIDGGGTKTKVMVIDEKLNILYENTSGPSSLDTVSEEITFKNISSALNDFFNLDTYKEVIFKTVFAGLGGIFHNNDKLRLIEILKKLQGVNKNTLLIGESDAENALASGLLFDEGIALIAGTGMVAYGKNLSGETHKAGGMGYKEGDLGSSYDLGINALRAISRALDHRHEDTSFTDELKKHLDIKTMSDLQNVTEKWYTERTKVASLAPFVTKHANLGNPYAQNICNNAVYELSIAVKSVQTTLKLENPILVIVGSLGNVDGYFKSSLHKLLNEMIPTIKITEPKIDPAYAAAQLALIQSHK